MTRTLLDISDDLVALGDLLTEAGGDIDAGDGALQAWFEQLGEERDEKLDNYCALIREMELRASVRMAELERLQLRVAVDQNAAKRLKDRLKLFLDIQGISKLETRRYKVGVQANGGKLPLEVTVAAEQLPERFQRVSVTVNSDAIRAAIEAGEAVQGCSIGERGTHVRIR